MEEKIETESIIETGKSKKFIIGMKVLCLYFGYTIISGLAAFYFNNALFGPIPYGKTFFTIYNWLSILFTLIMIFGLVQRRIFAYKLILWFTGYAIAYAIVHFVLSMLYLSKLPDIYVETFHSARMTEETIKSFVYYGVAYSLVPNAIIFWYVYTRRYFFTK